MDLNGGILNPNGGIADSNIGFGKCKFGLNNLKNGFRNRKIGLKDAVAAILRQNYTKIFIFQPEETPVLDDEKQKKLSEKSGERFIILRLFFRGVIILPWRSRKKHFS